MSNSTSCTKFSSVSVMYQQTTCSCHRSAQRGIGLLSDASWCTRSALVNEDGAPLLSVRVTAGAASDHASLSNNYSRTGGQNVGNFINDDRRSSRVLAPPGGQSSIHFG